MFERCEGICLKLLQLYSFICHFTTNMHMMTRPEFQITNSVVLFLRKMIEQQRLESDVIQVLWKILPILVLPSLITLYSLQWLLCVVGNSSAVHFSNFTFLNNQVSSQEIPFSVLGVSVSNQRYYACNTYINVFMYVLWFLNVRFQV